MRSDLSIDIHRSSRTQCRWASSLSGTLYLTHNPQECKSQLMEHTRSTWAISQDRQERAIWDRSAKSLVLKMSANPSSPRLIQAQYKSIRSRHLNAWPDPSFASASRICCAVLVAASILFASGQAHSADTASLEPGSSAIERSITTLQRQQRVQLEAIKRQFRSFPRPPARVENEAPYISERRESYLALERKLAEIEKRILLEERTAVAWDRAADPVLRSYYDRIRQRIEAQGNRDFPKDAGSSLYGRVHVSFTILPQGGIQDIEISEATSEKLGAHAIRILEAAAPFETFPPSLARNFDRIVIGAPFTFANK